MGVLCLGGCKANTHLFRFQYFIGDIDNLTSIKLSLCQKNRSVSTTKCWLYSLSVSTTKCWLIVSNLRHPTTSPPGSPLCQLLADWDPFHHPKVLDRELPLLLRLHRLLHLHRPRPLLRVLQVLRRVDNLASVIDPVELFLGQQRFFFFPTLDHSLVERSVAPLVLPLPGCDHRDIVHEEDTVLDFLGVWVDGNLKVVDCELARGPCTPGEGGRFSVFWDPTRILTRIIGYQLSGKKVNKTNIKRPEGRRKEIRICPKIHLCELLGRGTSL